VRRETATRVCPRNALDKVYPTKCSGYNVCAESFCHSLKAEAIQGEYFTTRQQRWAQPCLTTSRQTTIEPRRHSTNGATSARKRFKAQRAA